MEDYAPGLRAIVEWRPRTPEEIKAAPGWRPGLLDRAIADRFGVPAPEERCTHRYSEDQGATWFRCVVRKDQHHDWHPGKLFDYGDEP
jgi:hypothetical protein